MGDKFFHEVWVNGREVETRLSNKRYAYANIWWLGRPHYHHVATLSKNQEKPGRENKYGWVAVAAIPFQEV